MCVKYIVEIDFFHVGVLIWIKTFIHASVVWKEQLNGMVIEYI